MIIDAAKNIRHSFINDLIVTNTIKIPDKIL